MAKLPDLSDFYEFYMRTNPYRVGDHVVLVTRGDVGNCKEGVVMQILDETRCDVRFTDGERRSFHVMELERSNKSPRRMMDKYSDSSNPFHVGDRVLVRGEEGVGTVTMVVDPTHCRVQFRKESSIYSTVSSVLNIRDLLLTDDEDTPETPRRKIPETPSSVHKIPPRTPKVPQKGPTRPVVPYTTVLDAIAGEHEGFMHDFQVETAAKVLSKAYGVPEDEAKKDLRTYLRIHRTGPTNESATITPLGKSSRSGTEFN